VRTGVAVLQAIERINRELGTCWIVMSMLLVIVLREVTVIIPVKEMSGFAQRLSEAAKSARYTIEQESPTSFVGMPKRGLGRSFECYKLHVHLAAESLSQEGSDPFWLRGSHPAWDRL
jgi:hypothetical protein